MGDGTTDGRFRSRACADAAYAPSMRIVSGKVVDGKVVVEGGPLDEGTVVTVVAPEDDETFELSGEDESALLESMAQADRGEVVPATTVLDRLRRHE